MKTPTSLTVLGQAVSGAGPDFGAAILSTLSVIIARGVLRTGQATGRNVGLSISDWSPRWGKMSDDWWREASFSDWG